MEASLVPSGLHEVYYTSGGVHGDRSRESTARSTLSLHRLETTELTGKVGIGDAVGVVEHVLGHLQREVRVADVQLDAGSVPEDAFGYFVFR